VRLRPRKAALELDPYVPGRAAEDDDHGLASNESSLGPSPATREAIVRAVDRVHRYPDPLATGLRRRLGTALGVDPRQILVGNGSDELIYLLCLAYLPLGGTVITADPPYRLHELVPLLHDGRVRRVPLRNWVHDLPSMAMARADMAFICNPHNPTGTTVNAGAIKAFIEQSPATVTVVDEAYIDFSSDPERLTALPLARDGRLIVLRTFSKIMGLAGLRLGYLVGPIDVVDVLQRIRAPFSVNSLAQVAGSAELDDPEQRRRRRELVLTMRPRVRELFARAGYQTVPSEANFILVLAPDEDQLVARLAEHRISTRPGKTLGLPGSVRVTLPSAHGLRLLEAALFSTPVMRGARIG
jgi:histidinol-phosphate aminotransferase